MLMLIRPTASSSTSRIKVTSSAPNSVGGILDMALLPVGSKRYRDNVTIVSLDVSQLGDCGYNADEST